MNQFAQSAAGLKNGAQNAVKGTLETGVKGVAKGAQGVAKGAQVVSDTAQKVNDKAKKRLGKGLDLVQQMQNNIQQNVGNLGADFIPKQLKKAPKRLLETLDVRQLFGSDGFDSDNENSRESRNTYDWRYSDKWDRECPELKRIRMSRTSQGLRRSLSRETFDADRNRIVALIESIVDNSWFDGFVALVLLANAISIGLEQQLPPEDASPEVFKMLDLTFLGIYMMEFLFRVISNNGEFLRNNWLLFDGLIVLFGILTELFLPLSDTATDGGYDNFWSGGELSTSSSFASSFDPDVLKALRCIRLVRMLSMVEDLWTVSLTFVYSFQPLLWTVVFLTVIVFMFAITVAELADGNIKDQLANNRRGTLSEDSGMMRLLLSDRQKKLDPLVINSYDNPDYDIRYSPHGNQYQRTLPAVLALFQIMTLDNWSAATRDIIDQTGRPGFMIIFFIIFISISSLALMNLVTAVVFESATKRTNEEDFVKNNLFLYNMVVQKARMQSFKNALESNGIRGHNATINHTQFPLLVKEIPSIQRTLEHLGLSTRILKVRVVFAILDYNDQGEIPRDYFIRAMLVLENIGQNPQVVALVASASSFRSKKYFLVKGLLQEDPSLTLFYKSAEEVLHHVEGGKFTAKEAHIIMERKGLIVCEKKAINEDKKTTVLRRSSYPAARDSLGHLKCDKGTGKACVNPAGTKTFRKGAKNATTKSVVQFTKNAISKTENNKNNKSDNKDDMNKTPKDLIETSRTVGTKTSSVRFLERLEEGGDSDESFDLSSGSEILCITLGEESKEGNHDGNHDDGTEAVVTFSEDGTLLDPFEKSAQLFDYTNSNTVSDRSGESSRSTRNEVSTHPGDSPDPGTRFSPADNDSTIFPTPSDCHNRCEEESNSFEVIVANDPNQTGNLSSVREVRDPTMGVKSTPTGFSEVKSYPSTNPVQFDSLEREETMLSIPSIPSDEILEGGEEGGYAKMRFLDPIRELGAQNHDDTTAGQTARKRLPPLQLRENSFPMRENSYLSNGSVISDQVSVSKVVRALGEKSKGYKVVESVDFEDDKYRGDDKGRKTASEDHKYPVRYREDDYKTDVALTRKNKASFVNKEGHHGDVVGSEEKNSLSAYEQADSDGEVEGAVNIDGVELCNQNVQMRMLYMLQGMSKRLEKLETKFESQGTAENRHIFYPRLQYRNEQFLV